MADQPRNVSIEPQQRIFLTELSWENINEPGAYVEIGTGDLYRIPQEALMRASTSYDSKGELGSFKTCADKQGSLYYNPRSKDDLC